LWPQGRHACLGGLPAHLPSFAQAVVCCPGGHAAHQDTCSRHPVWRSYNPTCMDACKPPHGLRTMLKSPIAVIMCGQQLGPGRQLPRAGCWPSHNHHWRALVQNGDSRALPTCATGNHAAGYIWLHRANLCMRLVTPGWAQGRRLLSQQGCWSTASPVRHASMGCHNVLWPQSACKP